MIKGHFDDESWVGVSRCNRRSGARRPGGSSEVRASLGVARMGAAKRAGYVPPAAENGEPRLARLRSGRSNCGSRASAAVSGMMESADEWRQLGHDAVVALQRILGGRDGLRRRNSAAVLRERVQCSE